jgi:DNA-binding transcriptional LysR family regulator
VITISDDAMTALDIPTVQAFLLVAELESFTRAAEVLGTTQAAVSMKLQRLEAVMRKRLVERSPRAVRLTADGAAFLAPARALIDAHERALSPARPAIQQLSLGISDHASGPELVPLMRRLNAVAPQLVLSVTSGFSREILDAYDAGKLDAVIVRQEGSRRGGEKLIEDEFGWFAAPSFGWRRDEPLSAGQGRHCLERGLCRRRRHGGRGRCARRACAGAAGAADRSRGPDRHGSGPRPAAARNLEGDAAFKSERSRKACCLACLVGHLPQRASQPR